MATVSATSITKAAAVTSALAAQQAAVTALATATTNLQNAQMAYRQSMASDGVDPLNAALAPIVLTPVVVYVPSNG